MFVVKLSILLSLVTEDTLSIFRLMSLHMEWSSMSC